MRMYDIMAKKRDGCVLCEQEIQFFVEGYTKGEIPDYMASALLMAIFINGMTDEETVFLTKAMADSGEKIDLSAFGNLSVDKHSTGGVGDKTTLIVAPIVAACGGVVTKMSGRGLGFTGGTVDKLESIPGYNLELSQQEFIGQAKRIGVSVVGQSGNLTPADKKLYALRDVTATVESIPLITSSVMSKKIAAGARNLVLDVKYGSGAFMKTLEDAERLAYNMVKIGRMCGINTAALITDMNKPLGYAVGNSLELIEAVEVLVGNCKGDLYEVSVSLAGNMLSLVKGISKEEGIFLAREAIESKAAYKKLLEWISTQGGDINYIKNTDMFQKAKYSYTVNAKLDGYISQMDTQKIGEASMTLGAGRAKKEDSIDYSAGIIIAAKTGDFVNAGEPLATLYTNNEASISVASQMYLDAITLSQENPEKVNLIYKTVR